MAAYTHRPSARERQPNCCLSGSDFRETNWRVSGFVFARVDAVFLLHRRGKSAERLTIVVSPIV